MAGLIVGMKLLLISNSFRIFKKSSFVSINEIGCFFTKELTVEGGLP